MLQTLDLGAAADDGTGTVLRDGGALINDNFRELAERPWLAPVLDSRSAPPFSPAPQPGNRYLVSPPASGAFIGREGQIAEALTIPGGLGWSFLSPVAGTVLWHAAQGKHLSWNGTAWVDFTPAVPALPVRLAAIAALPAAASGLLRFPTATTADMVALGQAARPFLAAETTLEQRGLLALGSAAQYDLAVPGGVASLDGSGRLSPTQIPDLTITDVFVVADQAAMLALTAQTGDLAIRSDLARSFILRQSPASTASNWVELPTPPDAVLSVFGRTGAIIPAGGDYSAAQISFTPTPGLAAGDVQTALALLDASKTTTALANALPQGLGAAAAGTGGMAARSDHIHPHGDQSGGTLHAAATPTSAGFLAAADKLKLDRLPVDPSDGALRGYVESVQGPLTANGALSLPDPAAGNLLIINLAGDSVVTLPTIAGPSGTASTLHVLLRQDGSGNRAVSWGVPAGDRLAWDQSSSAPALSINPNTATLLVFTRFAALSLWVAARVWKEA